MCECLNYVAKEAGSVLIRALEPICGIPQMQRRRPAAKSIEDLASGPGKLTLAMGITRKLNGIDLTGDRIHLRALDAKERFEIGVSPRIGISKSADWPLRFFIAGNRFVSR